MCDITGVTVGKCKGTDSAKEGSVTLEVVYDHRVVEGGSRHGSPSLSQGGDQHTILTYQVLTRERHNQVNIVELNSLGNW